MDIDIAPAGDEDLAWLIAHDRHVGEGWIKRCVSAGEYLLARSHEEAIGFLRFSMFWGKSPTWI